MSTPHLSILIPTFNRPSELRTLLEKIYCVLCIEKPDLIEVIISDNSEEANSVINKAGVDQINQRLGENGRQAIVYICNGENIGYGKNLIQLHNLSRGKYFWFVSDGDLLMEQTVGVVLRQIESAGAEYYTFQISINYGSECYIVPVLSLDVEESFEKHFGLPFMYLSGSIHRRNLKSIAYRSEFENFTQIYIYFSNLGNWKSHGQINAVVLSLNGSEVRRFSSLETFYSEVAIVNWLREFSFFSGGHRSNLISEMLGAAYRRLCWDMLAIRDGELVSAVGRISRADIARAWLIAPNWKGLILALLSILPRGCLSAHGVRAFIKSIKETLKKSPSW